MITPEHVEFGRLKAQYHEVEDETKKLEIMEDMKQNLLQRNDDDPIVVLTHMQGPSIDILSTENVTDLYIADASLTNQGK